MKEKLIDKNEIRNKSAFLRGPIGNFLLNIGMSFTGMNKVNQIYDDSKQYEGVAFCHHLLQNIGVKVVIENLDVLDQFKDQPFITVSNHPYGHIDGIMAIDVIGAKRPDYKMMVNFILGMIDTMAMHFIVVNPYQSGKLAERSSLEGVKQCIEHLKQGHPVGFFPAGAVSKTQNLKLEVKDREWQAPVIKLIKKAKVPVIPMYFSGKNSSFFNFLDLVSWRLRSLRLGHEVYNKRGKTVYLRLGQPITVEEQTKYSNIAEFGEFLKSRTYALAKSTD